MFTRSPSRSFCFCFWFFFLEEFQAYKSDDIESNNGRSATVASSRMALHGFLGRFFYSFCFWIATTAMTSLVNEDTTISSAAVPSAFQDEYHIIYTHSKQNLIFSMPVPVYVLSVLSVCHTLMS